MGERNRRHDKKAANYGRIKTSKKVEPPVDLGRRNFLKRFIPGVGPVRDHNETGSWSPAEWSTPTKQGVAGQIGLLALGAGATFLIPKEDPIYSGSIDNMVGKHILSNERFSGMMEAVQETMDPFLQKLGAQVMLLHTTHQKPTEFPDWISENGFPIPISYDFGGTSQAEYNFRTGSESTRFILRSPSQNTENRLLEITPIEMGINLGDDPLFKAQMGELGEGVVLIKETMSHMLGISISSTFYDYMTRNAILQFLDLDHQPISDRDRQIRMGAAVSYLELTNTMSSTWKAVDAIPIYIAGSSMLDLEEQQKISLPHNPTIDNQLYYAAALLRNDSGLRARINQVRTEWLNSPGLLPSGSLAEDVFSPDLRSAVDNLYPKSHSYNRVHISILS